MPRIRGTALVIFTAILSTAGCSAETAAPPEAPLTPTQSVVQQIRAQFDRNREDAGFAPGKQLTDEEISFMAKKACEEMAAGAEPREVTPFLLDQDGTAQLAKAARDVPGACTND